MSEPIVFDAVVLAGGHSRRMGTDKALLPHPSTDQSLILHQLELIAQLGSKRLFVSARLGQKLPTLPTGVDRIDDAGTDGPLAGIIAALELATAPHLLVLAVDLPHIQRAVLRELLSSVSTIDHGVFARLSDRPEPLVSVVPGSLCSTLRDALSRGHRSPRDLFTGSLAASMRPVDFTDSFPFKNWNRPDDI